MLTLHLGYANVLLVYAAGCLVLIFQHFGTTFGMFPCIRRLVLKYFTQLLCVALCFGFQKSPCSSSDSMDWYSDLMSVWLQVVVSEELSHRCSS